MFIHSIHGVECAREVRAAWRALFLPDSEGADNDAGPFFAADIRTFFFSADVFKKCALLALHSIAEEGRGVESGHQVPDQGDEGEFGCPKSPLWESEVEVWSEDESDSSSNSREESVCNEALQVIGLYGQRLSLPEGLGACEGGIKLSHGPGHAVPGNE